MTTKKLEEDFPLLPAPKQIQCTNTSRRSSVSSVSSQAMSVSTQGTEAKPWLMEIVEEAVCRRHNFCKCAECSKRNSVLNKRKWNNLTRFPCNDATILYEQDIVKVIHMASYGKRGEFRVFVFTQEENGTEIQGWVHPDCLGGKKAVRAALEHKKIAEALKNLKKDFETLSAFPEHEPVQQHESCKPVARPVPKPVSPLHTYQFKELVLARNALGEDWYRAEVVSTNPLTLKCPQWQSGVVFDERNVKRHPTSNFVAVQAMEVRTNEHPKSFVKKTLPKGTVVGVVQMNGQYARITSPVCGWVQMRSSDALYAIEQNYEFKLMKQRFFLGGLPATADRAKVTRALQKLDGVVLPSHIQFFRQGDNFCAYLYLMRSSHYKQVVHKTIEVDGRKVTCDWCINYLRCQAARELRRS